ncbi:tetratricopeptide repeat protein [Lentzea sp. NEAU-D13]|uniref:Tetratricopeptide repeat protein n=1 Tax=Lentzea alba TaxID=2714351 RepID=A0A7C9VLQ5_9PSEU|nr:BTAD domain-containing putative transcriptional regulator [Lentzea alba]NGY58633.1 tetratricopeptide repeat protein [Lentzea alba]
MRAEFRVLGPLEVLLDGEPVAVPAGRCHVLLATLLLRPNQFVSADELIERIWAGAPSKADRARKTLQMVVARLRSALGTADCVRTRPGGYLAVVDPDQLDLLRFRALVGSGDFGAASALWRGPVLANVTSDALHCDDVPRLAEERLNALELRIEADLDRGLGREIVVELRSLVADHPLRESFWRHLMLALYRAGQQAEALAAYRQVRAKLADELGVDPGLPLQELHERILRADVPAGGRQVPRQLPSAVLNFVGRDEELRLLAKTTGVTVVHGVGGVGKTALVLRWAREVRDEFPDGDLYVNLRGFDPEAQPVDPAAVAEMLLIGLGVEETPPGAEARFALLRTTLVDRRLLLVLDNAASARQVLPLLPGAAGVRVVITSRNQLRALVSQHDAKAISLRQLDFGAARSLLVAVLGESRIDTEPESAREIAERCAGLPLALRVFAERVLRFPDTSLRQFVDELGATRLDALSDFEDVDVRSVFSWSYRALDAESARMFRLLSIHPGPDFDVSAAAALASVSVAQARRLVERLVADHLVQSRTPGRYDLHDLLRAYAAELCGDDEAAAFRLTEWYVHTLENATNFQTTMVLIQAGEVTSGVVPQEFSSWFDTLVWRRQEWANLKAVMFAALARGWHRHAQLFPLHLFKYIVMGPARRAEAVEMFEAVATFGSPREQGILKLKLASVYEDVRRHDDALRAFEEAMPLVREAGERYTEAAGLINMSSLYRKLDRVDEAIACLQRGLTIAAEIESVYLECAAQTNLVSVLHATGRAAEALPHVARSEALAPQHGDEYLKLRVRSNRAAVLISLGQHAEALPELETLAGVWRQFGDTPTEAFVLGQLGIALKRLNRREEAAVAWERSVRLWRELDDARADEVISWMTE